MSGDPLQKIREVALYLAERCSDDPRFGRVKLAELLFRCDFAAYAKFGESLTGAHYRRQPDGPLADEWSEAERDLSNSADIGWLTGDQLALVEEVVQRHQDEDGTDLQKLSRSFPGYALAADGEAIPYHSVFISREAPTQADIDWGLAVARELQEA